MPKNTRSALILVAILGGCAGASASARGQGALPVLRARPAHAATWEDGGLRVLVNGASSARRDRALTASSSAELARVWGELGVRDAAPTVDFATHVVLAATFRGSACPEEIVGGSIDARARFALETLPLEASCFAAPIRSARAVAVPRRILTGNRLWWRSGDEVAADELLTIGAPATGASPAGPATLDVGERPRVEHPSAIVELPARERIALRTLEDGREVWVAHHRDGRIAVVAAQRPTERSGVFAPVGWSYDAGRLGTHDAFGTSVHGGAPLQRFGYARLPGDRLAIGEPIAADAVATPVQARAEAPVLEGSARPYTDRTAVAGDRIVAGQLVLVDLPIVYGESGPPRLCAVPDEPKLEARFRGCPDDAPAIAGAPAEARAARIVLAGPHLVLRRERTLEMVIVTGTRESSTALDAMPRGPAPAAAGPARRRGELALGTAARGDTAGSRDAHALPCVAGAGSPDEVWEFVAPESGRFAFFVEAAFDSAVAVVSTDGRVIACNDDQHGYDRASLAHASLRAGQRTRVVVDGFHGARGSYSVRVRRDPPLADDGVLQLGHQVGGDTTLATDDRSAGCFAPANDQTYRIRIAARGTYRIRVDAAGWRPLLAIYHPDRPTPLTCGAGAGSPLVEEVTLEPGTYEVVVDGGDPRQVGRYQLRVDSVGTRVAALP